MNEKQKMFADYYIETLNITKSYKKAYGEEMSDEKASANGSRLIRNDKVKEYIEKAMEIKSNERIASQDEVLEFLTQTMRGEVKDQLGLETPVKERVRSAELLGKRYEIFTEKVKVSETPIINDDI